MEAPKPATKVPAAPVPKPAEDENPFAVFSQCEHLSRSLTPPLLSLVAHQTMFAPVQVHSCGGERRRHLCLLAFCVNGVSQRDSERTSVL